MFPIFAAISRFFARKKRQNAAVSEIAILCVVGDKREQSIIRETCREHGWTAVFADGVNPALSLAARRKYQIVLLDRELAGGEWRQAIRRLAAPDALCILLVFKVFDDDLWTEVVRSGGYDILAKPLLPADLERAIRLAWSYWIGAHRHPAAPRGVAT